MRHFILASRSVILALKDAYPDATPADDMEMTMLKTAGSSTLRSLLGAGLATGLVVGAAPGLASQQCGARDELIEVLGQRYHENRQALGLSGHAAVFELYVSEQGSWTLLSTAATTGVACIVAAGEAWQDAPKFVAGRDS